MKIFTLEECKKIVKKFDLAEKAVENHFFVGHSLGIMNLNITLEYVPYITSILQKKYTNIKFSNTYTRSYLKNSYLTIHTDRPGLDLTLSVLLENNENIDWSFNISKNSRCIKRFGEWELKTNGEFWKTNYEAIKCEVGNGILCEGRRYPHWREIIPENVKNGRYVCCFYHWTFI